MHSHYLPPWLTLLRLLLWNYSRFKNSSLVVSSPHTFTLFNAPNIQVQTFLRTYRKPSRAGHRGTGSSQRRLRPLCGRWKAAPLCVARTSVPNRHCNSLIWFGKGVEEHYPASHRPEAFCSPLLYPLKECSSHFFQDKTNSPLCLLIVFSVKNRMLFVKLILLGIFVNKKINLIGHVMLM